MTPEHWLYIAYITVLKLLPIIPPIVFIKRDNELYCPRTKKLRLPPYKRLMTQTIGEQYLLHIQNLRRPQGLANVIWWGSTPILIFQFAEICF